MYLGLIHDWQMKCFSFEKATAASRERLALVHLDLPNSPFGGNPRLGSLTQQY